MRRNQEEGQDPFVTEALERKLKNKAKNSARDKKRDQDRQSKRERNYDEVESHRMP